MMTGQKSRLAISNVCQKCAKCCKVFEMSFLIDTALRLKWMPDEQIQAEDTKFCDWGGMALKKVTFKKTCTQLGCSKGIYFCKIHDKERPDFCCTYPDNTFNGVESWNTQKIQAIIDENKGICPLFEKYTVEDIVDKLYDKKTGYLLPCLETDLSSSTPKNEGA